jgi:hypothetical protein
VQQHAGAGMVKCSKGHDVPRGERYCPACREDTWGLEGGASPHGGGFIPRT